MMAGEQAVAKQSPTPDDEMLAAQLARLERRLEGADSERRRVADLYQAGVIDDAELARRVGELDARRRNLGQEREALIVERTELGEDNQLSQRIADFAEQALAGIDALDFEGRQQLLRLVLEDVRVRGWQVELRLRLPLDDPPAGTNTTASSTSGWINRSRSQRGSRRTKEAVSSNDGLRSIGQAAQKGAECGRREHRMSQHRLGLAGPQCIGVVDRVAACERRVDQGHRLGPHVRTSRSITEIQVLREQPQKPQVLGQRGRQHKPGIGDEMLV
jgi:hypothetical protein